MKICIVNNLYPPYHRGGAEQIVKKTIEGLLHEGHYVVLLTATPKESGFVEKGKLKIYRIKQKNLFFYTNAHKHNFLMRLFWHIIDIFHFGISSSVKNILQKEKPDVVHTHNLMGMSFMIPSVIRKLKIFHVHTLHDVQLVEPSGLIIKERENTWRYNGIFTKMYVFVIKKLMGSPDIVLSPSNFLLDFYKKWGFFKSSSCQVLRNPLTFIPRVKKVKEKKTFDFLYLGQLEEHKGIFQLLEAFERGSFNKNIHLHVIGKGSKLEVVKKYAQKNKQIKIYNNVSRGELSELFLNMDVSVMPSLCLENSPTVLFESFAFGLPVVASKQDAFLELIEEGVNGWLFDLGYQDSLLKALKYCTQNQDEVQKMSKNTKKLLTGLSLEEYLKNLKKIYIH